MPTLFLVLVILYIQDNEIYQGRRRRVVLFWLAEALP